MCFVRIFWKKTSGKTGYESNWASSINKVIIIIIIIITALNEVGIYRVSGVTSDVQHFKKLFDKSESVETFYSLFCISL